MLWHCCDLEIQSRSLKVVEWVKLNEYYHQAKFDFYHTDSVQENHNVIVFATYRWSAGRPNTDNFSWLKKEKSHAVKFLIPVFQTGHDYFLGTCIERYFAGGKFRKMSRCWTLANVKTQHFPSEYKKILFADESCHALCKVCWCDINISYCWVWNGEVPTTMD